MSHEFESGFVVREAAWHGLATVLQGAPTVEEAIKAAGLDWQVDTCPIEAMTTNGIVPITDHKAVVRVSDNSILGVVSDRYVPLQNVEAFGWFQKFLDDGHCVLESAGSLKKGQYVWILAKIKNADMEVSPGDRVTGYLLLSSAHNGTKAVIIGFTPIRVVCWNTMSAALGKLDTNASVAEGLSVRIVHSAQMKSQLKAVQTQIDFTQRRIGEVVQFAKILRAKQIGPKEYYTFLESVYAEERNAMREELAKLYAIYNDKQQSVEERNKILPEIQAIEQKLSKPIKREGEMGKLVHLFEAGPGAEMAGKTLWGAVCAVTHYEEHQKPGSNETRLASSWFGGTVQEIRERAMKVAAAMA